MKRGAVPKGCATSLYAGLLSVLWEFGKGL